MRSGTEQLGENLFLLLTVLPCPQELTARDAVCKQVFRKVR